MADVSIVGAAGYTGQETLDRVLGHPALASSPSAPTRSPAARRRPSTLGSRGATMPDFVDERCSSRPRGRRHDRLPAARGCGCDRRTGATESSSICRVHTGCATPELRGLVRLHAPPARRARRVELRIARARRRPGRLIANPGCYATAALLALGPLQDVIEPGFRRRGRVVGDDGCGPHAQGRVPRGLGARERHAVPGRRAPARAGDRPAPRLPGVAHPTSPSAPSWPDRNVQRPLDGPDLRAILEATTPAARSSRFFPKGRRRSSPVSSTPTGPRSGSSATASPIARS